MDRRWVMLLLLGCSSASGADFLDDPKALCGYFEGLGMKAQFQWGPAPRGGTWFCQYADEFSGSTTHVRAAQVYINPEKKTVGLGLSIQVLGGSRVRAEAADVLVAYIERFYSAQQRAVPTGLPALLSAGSTDPLDDAGLTVSGYETRLWEAQRVVGATWRRDATPAQLAGLQGSVSQEEKAAAAATQKRLEARCDAAVAASGLGAEPASLQRKVTPLSASRILVELSDASGTYSCQVCDEMDPKVQCGTMGVMLSFRGADGSNLRLPAEIRQKCEYQVQKHAMDSDSGVFIDQEIVKRISTREVPNDKRYVFEHALDGIDYRCVVRKSDLDFTLEYRQVDGSWRGIVGGIML